MSQITTRADVNANRSSVTSLRLSRTLSAATALACTVLVLSSSSAWRCTTIAAR